MMKFFVSTLALLFAVVELHSQGCSDAGGCSITAMQNVHSEESDPTSWQVKIATAYGIGQESVQIITPSLELHYQALDDIALFVRGTVNIASGNGIGSVTSLGDIFLGATTTVPLTEKAVLGLTLATKIPLSEGNSKYNDQPLPMVYQGSMGTADIIIGGTVTFQQLHLGIALQQPLSYTNENSFLSSPTESPFVSSRRLRRKGDLIIRAMYGIPLSEQLALTPGILPIVHLGNDTYEDAQGNRQLLEGSAGLTLNITAGLSWNIAKSNALQLNVGFPAIARDIQPDGLLRAFALSVEYNVAW